ncbi:hypothetical protein RclHR1_00590013 [Rhizophagus clarus]|uniref:F-box domain-containing protein n=1 Tax=Rhizophagus clarus TaxID=94130 RepID=A0A2Z6SGQ4_9GLOM|nr:hypothetical protein RclHR1_00590013 [Rhizophagus clarus]
MQSISSSNINLPPEIFIEVCSFLPPADLITLSQVCREFRGYLCAPNSSTTQEIWKKSRLQFISKEEMPPPKGVCEEKYVKLLMTERGCQICKHNKECKVYWEFLIRCCHKCYSTKTVSRFELMSINCPKEFIEIMPYTHVGLIVCSKYYWIEQLDFAYFQYHSLSKSEKKIWLKNKKRVFDSIMNYVKQRELREYREKSFFRNWFFFPHNCDMLLENTRSSSSSSLPPSPPLFRFFAKDLPQLIHYHIQRLESEPSKSTFGIKLHDYKNSNERKRDKRVNFIKTRKMGEKEPRNKFNRCNMKGKNFKFSYKYG